MIKKRVAPILLSLEQVEALQKIQQQERAKSPLGVAPTIHVITRGLMDKAIAQFAEGA